MQRSGMYRGYLAVVLTLTVWMGSAQATLYGPSPYSGFADSPFSGLGFSYFHLENFADGALNTPGASSGIASVLQGGGLAVDGDPSGSLGESLPVVSLQFDADALGSLPTHVGIVWTGGGFSSSGTDPVPPYDITFEAFGSGGQSLGVVTTPIPADHGQGLDSGIFFGLSDAGGIARLTLSTPSFESSPFTIGIETDHLQYGRLGTPAVPEPGTLALAGGALAVLGFVRRRRQ